MTIQPTKKYDIVYAKTEDGEDIKFRFVLTLSKPIRDEAMGARIIQLLGIDLPGIDGYTAMGRYTLEIIIARTFDPEVVLDALKEELEVILSTILQPGPKKLVT